LNHLDIVGMTMWVVGFAFEVIADEQKNQWRISREHKKSDSALPFINSGLWSISRHPNYFGEIFLWSGVFISACNSFTTPYHYLAIISPLLTATLLIFVSGIPLLEKASDKKFADNAEYKKYKSSTPVLVPFIGRRGDAAF
jgi:steroid 5-alpha reductase family enzyme